MLHGTGSRFLVQGQAPAFGKLDKACFCDMIDSNRCKEGCAFLHGILFHACFML